MFNCVCTWMGGKSQEADGGQLIDRRSVMGVEVITEPGEVSVAIVRYVTLVSNGVGPNTTQRMLKRELIKLGAGGAHRLRSITPKSLEGLM